MSAELDFAMDWVQNLLLRLLVEQEMVGTTLHLVDGARNLDVVVLPGQTEEALATARALIVVRAPAVAVIATEAQSARIDPLQAPHDPLVRDWWARRARGAEAPVHELPPDYRTELLILVGEDRDGACAQRQWRIGGEVPQRTFEPYDMETPGGLHPPVHPLFMTGRAQAAGIDPDHLRRTAEHFLAHTRAFQQVYSREDGER